ncbi:hypothetical protein BJX70DRAFT_282130 [Aspergillus crustosus]
MYDTPTRTIRIRGVWTVFLSIDLIPQLRRFCCLLYFALFLLNLPPHVYYTTELYDAQTDLFSCLSLSLASYYWKILVENCIS